MKQGKDFLSPTQPKAAALRRPSRQAGTGASWLSPIMSRGALQVLIKRGEGLPRADLNGLADPYVRVTVRHMTRETTVVKECLDPVWDEPLQFLGPLEEFRNDELILKVCDRDVLKHDDAMGGCSL